ncbi:MAG: sodium:calcium antiporter [Bryobacterales bacterium]|nr:sodium:calcium antiporter [Bryobacterales bacterium]
MIWLQFFLCVSVILYSGTRLSTYGDVIAEKTGLGRTWIGVVLMASVTSLPELITGISSVSIFDLPDIAAGDVLGSCMFNLLILGMLDIRRDRMPISAIAHQGQVLTAAFGILLLGVTTLSILGASRIPSAGWIGASSPVLLLVYLLAMRLVFRYERRRIAELLEDLGEQAQYEHMAARTAYGRFGAHAVVIVLAAAYLPHLGDEIARITGLGQTFVGSIFIALTTSLPEVVVSRAALQMGAVDLAVGGILGSNLFNLAILAVDDFCYFRGPLMRSISANHAISAAAAMTMTAIITISLVYRHPKRVALFSWDAIGTTLVFVLASLLLYAGR